MHMNSNKSVIVQLRVQLRHCVSSLNKWRLDLAVAGYYRPTDFIEMFGKLESYRHKSHGFSWHFAHYSDCIDNSIYYIIRNRPENA